MGGVWVVSIYRVVNSVPYDRTYMSDQKLGNGLDGGWYV